MAKREDKQVNKVVEVVENEEGVFEDIKDREENTLVWFFVAVGVVFASFLIPYFWVESSKTFEFGGVNFVVEEYEYLKIFHGRFISLTNPDLNYNIFFRTDPRENDVEVSGALSDFKYGGIISLSPEVDFCRGDLSRVMLDLGSFLRQGVGVGVIKSGSISESVANETGRTFATCESINDRTIVIIELGEPKIVKSEVNPHCYTIYAENCEDSKVVEKFIMQTIIDFRKAHGLFEEVRK